jgi:hypothetical protein
LIIAHGLLQQFHVEFLLQSRVLHDLGKNQTLLGADLQHSLDQGHDLFGDILVLDTTPVDIVNYFFMRLSLIRCLTCEELIENNS